MSSLYTVSVPFLRGAVNTKKQHKIKFGRECLFYLQVQKVKNSEAVPHAVSGISGPLGPSVQNCKEERDQYHKPAWQLVQPFLFRRSEMVLEISSATVTWSGVNHG